MLERWIQHWMLLGMPWTPLLLLPFAGSLGRRRWAMARWNPNRLEITKVKTAKGRQLVQGLSRDVAKGGRQLARQGTHRHGSEKAVAGPRLKDSIRIRGANRPDRIVEEVFSDLDYAASMAKGSKAHRIGKARRGPKLLKFKWPRGEASRRLRGRRTRTGYFLFRQVRHPGNKRPNRFLQTPLALYARKWGFRVKIGPVTRGYLP